jgi:hypothetical protein
VNILLRLFLIPIGYLAAIFAAASLIALIEWLRAYGPVADDPVALSATTFIILTDWVFLFILIGWAAAIPSLAVAVLAEIFTLRSALFFCGAGLFVAFAASRFLDASMSPAVPDEPAVIAAAGLAGGLAYWVACGRWSGIRRSEPVRG